MVTLNKRQIKIIDFLEKKLDWITIENISKVFDVSERTIRNDLNSISALLKEFDILLERRPKVGVKLIIKNGQSINSILKDYNNKAYSSDERAVMIAIILLIKGNATIEKLSNYMRVSKNTLVNDLKIVEEELKKLNINIFKKSYYGLSIKNNNYEQLANGFLKLFNDLSDGQKEEIYKYLYKDIQLKENDIRKIIESIEEKTNVQYAEEALEEIERIILFTLCKSKVEQDYCEKSSNDLSKEFNTLKSSIEKFTDLHINNEKINYLIKVFKGSKKSKYISERQENEIDIVINEILNELCQIINIKIEAEYELIKQMAMHLNVAIYRLKNNLIIDNPMLEEIKYKMSFIYEITEQVLSNNKDIIGIEFPEAEIAYMAMYFGTLFEKYVKGNLIARILIVCNGGLATSSLLKFRLNLMIPELKIEAICRMKDANKYLTDNEIDFIVTTVPLQLSDYKVIQVNPLLEINDLENIKSEIYNKWYERNCKYLIERVKNKSLSDMERIIPEKYVQLNLPIEEWREAVKIASKPLIKDEKIKPVYVNDIIRVIETLGNYMVFIPEIAFVHATPENVIDNAVSLLTLKTPIEFGTKNKVIVKAIVVIANKEESKNLISLVNILMKDDNIKRFKNAVKYEEIKKIR